MSEKVPGYAQTYAPVVLDTEDEGVRYGKIDIIVRDAVVFEKATNTTKMPNAVSFRVHYQTRQFNDSQT
jgi:hypothetical protein